MNIGTVAKRSGVPAKTIRYYESIGLIASAGRSANGYRVYTAEEVETLRFVSHARSLGFSVKDVANLLTLWRDRSRASSDVKALARGHIAEIDAKIAELRSIRETLLQLVDRCHGDDRPDCPILESLAHPRHITGRALHLTPCHVPRPNRRRPPAHPAEAGVAALLKRFRPITLAMGALALTFGAGALVGYLYQLEFGPAAGPGCHHPAGTGASDGTADRASQRRTAARAGFRPAPRSRRLHLAVTSRHRSATAQAHTANRPRGDAAASGSRQVRRRPPWLRVRRCG